MGTTKMEDYLTLKELVQEISGIIEKLSGNILGPKQFTMVESRVSKRMMDLGMSKPAEYKEYINSNYVTESKFLVNLLTTHHSFFFREYIQFDYLRKVMPDLVNAVRERKDNTLRIWSAACSRGQEVYSLSMFMKKYLPTVDKHLRYEILGTDIDTDSVIFSQNGVYERAELKEVPIHFMADHWARGQGDLRNYVKAKKSIKEMVHFKSTNLLDFKNTVRGQTFDVIFCRNVFIYFRHKQISQIVRGFLDHLHPTGLIFIGVSEKIENLTGVSVKLLGKSIYCWDKPGAGVPSLGGGSPASAPSPSSKVVPITSTARPTTPSIAPATPSPMAIPKNIRVICVDDSKIILNLLKKTLTEDQGFEVVGTATNGKEAHELAQKTQFDLMTLDIHMPEMNGIDYLKNYKDKKHPPVLMISSASRDDASLAHEAFKFGAGDFVEKPSIENFSKRAEEIRVKGMILADEKSDAPATLSSVDRDFKTIPTIDNPNEKIRIILANLSARDKLYQVLKEFTGEQPPTIILFEGGGEVLENLSASIKLPYGYQMEFIKSEVPELKGNKFYFADFDKIHSKLLDKYDGRTASILVFGGCTLEAAQNIVSWPLSNIILEDRGHTTQKGFDKLKTLANDIIPITSFAYESVLYLSKK